MTLTDYLASLLADPSDPTSPNLIVGDGMLTPDQRDRVTGADYARRPYAVIVGLPRGLPLRLHNRGTRMTGGLDVHLNHPRALIGPPRDGATLAALQAALARAPDSVTEIAQGYALARPLTLGTEIDPRPETFDNLDGITATTRFTYAIWR